MLAFSSEKWAQYPPPGAAAEVEWSRGCGMEGLEARQVQGPGTHVLSFGIYLIGRSDSEINPTQPLSLRWLKQERSQPWWKGVKKEKFTLQKSSGDMLRKAVQDWNSMHFSYHEWKKLSPFPHLWSHLLLLWASCLCPLPFSHWIVGFFSYLFTGTLYIWRKSNELQIFSQCVFKFVVLLSHA